MKFIASAIIIIAAGCCTHLSAQELPQRDQVHMAIQEICPVSGQKLGEHGTPVQVKIGEETMFLCCQGCLKGKVSPQHWATIHANFAKAQKICPVMKHKLPENPKWTIIEGRIVYVCCPPCTKKVTADPAKYLEQLDELYLLSLKERRSGTRLP